MASEFSREFFSANRIVKADLHCARQPREQDLDKIKAELKSLYDATEVLLDVSVDESLLSGYVLQVGDRVFDNSGRHALDQMTGDKPDLATLKTRVEDYKPAANTAEGGTVVSAADGIVTVEGMDRAVYGEIVTFENGAKGMVESVEPSHLGIMLFDGAESVGVGTLVTRTGKRAGIPVGEAFLGRVINPLGEPIDGKGAIEAVGYNPIEKQAIFPNHHEPIIDTETWERVQELRKQRKRPNRYDEVGLFSGMLFCADCGHVMYQQRYQNKNRKQDCYICGSYKKRTRDCTAHFIRTDLLTAGVLSNLRQVTEYAAKHESRFVKLLIQQNEIGGKRKTAAATKQLEQAQERISEVSRIIKRLYEDNVNGKISDERFMELSADYEQEQRELKDRAAALQAELDKSQAATVNAEKFMGIVRKHLAFEELTPTLLREMIEKIVVHECSYDENGTRRQDIEIYYSFVGKIDLPEA